MVHYNKIDPTKFYFHYASNKKGFSTLNTRTHVRLLGPCFKTGGLTLFLQYLEAILEILAHKVSAKENTDKAVFSFRNPVTKIPSQRLCRISSIRKDWYLSGTITQHILNKRVCCYLSQIILPILLIHTVKTLSPSAPGKAMLTYNSWDSYALSPPITGPPLFLAE